MEFIEITRYVPDYETACLNCGQTPVVTGVDASGNAVYSSDMCGPCTWGEAEALDPSTW